MEFLSRTAAHARRRHGLRSVARAVALTLMAVGSVVFLAACGNPPAPTATGQAVTDGCQRNQIGAQLLQSPEWMYVYRDPTMRVATGTIRVAHMSGGDGPATHQSIDFNANMDLNTNSQYLLAPSSAQVTGEDQNRLHVEWESSALPTFAWPSDGDSATVWGSWIWDCSHWTGNGGAIIGERTEMHPMTAIAVTRKASYLSPTNQTQTDFFISSEGTGARAVEQCGYTLSPTSSSTYGTDFRACVSQDETTNVPHNAPQPIAGSYSFFVPAPPQPSPSDTLTYSVSPRIPDSQGTEQIQVVSPLGIQVTVTPPSTTPTEAAPIHYGKSFFVGWSGTQAAAPTHLSVTLDSIQIVHADPNQTSPDPAGGVWNMWTNINGYNLHLNDLIPGLSSVTDGTVLPINKTVDIYVPQGQPLNVLAYGIECDMSSGVYAGSYYVPAVAPCTTLDTTEPSFSIGNDYPGIVLDNYSSAGAAVGSHSSASVSTTNGFPGSPNISFGDTSQGNGDFVLKYHVN